LDYPTSNALIVQSLSPAVAISGAGLLTLGLLNRLSHLGTRVRQLNKEYRDSDETAQTRININEQIQLVLDRARMVRNALVMLYVAIGSMVLTAFSLAMGELGLLPKGAAIGFFLCGLGGIFIAVLQEVLEVTLALKALKKDIQANHPR
jgi:hypothetical protein